VKKILLFLFLFFSSLFADLPRILPSALQEGDLIALVFPASFLDKNREEAKEILDRKQEWLHLQGYRTITYPSEVNVYGYLAGSDAERAQSLMDAWKDPEVKAIWCVRGGYGTPRILDLLDYEWIKKHPKILIGMSDITALHHAIQEKTGLVTFLAPVFNFFAEKDSAFDTQYAFSQLVQMVSQPKWGTISLRDPSSFKVIRPGKASGKLIGGNLSLIAALCGTQWQLDTKDRILILEDIGEEIYRIDRLLWQLKEAGLLDQPAGIILGSWNGCKTTLTNSLTLDDVFAHYFGQAPYPVIGGFPSGHDKYQATIPLNTHAEIDTYNSQVNLLESAVSSY